MKYVFRISLDIFNWRFQYFPLLRKLQDKLKIIAAILFFLEQSNMWWILQFFPTRSCLPRPATPVRNSSDVLRANKFQNFN